MAKKLNVETDVVETTIDAEPVFEEVVDIDMYTEQQTNPLVPIIVAVGSALLTAGAFWAYKKIKQHKAAKTEYISFDQDAPTELTGDPAVEFGDVCSKMIKRTYF